MNVFYPLFTHPIWKMKKEKKKRKMSASVFTEKMGMYLPSALVNSLKVGKEMKVWDTECVGSRTQAMSLG